MDRDRYRAEAEEFSARFGRESYRLHAGLAGRSGLQMLYRRHRRLFDRDAVDAWRVTAEREPSLPAHRSMLRFCMEGHLASLTWELDGELARRESALAIPHGPGPVSLGQSLRLQALEPDPERRAEIERQRLDAQEEQLNPLRVQALELVHERSVQLGFSDHRALCERLLGIDLTELDAQAQRFLSITDRHFEATVGPVLIHDLGLGLCDLRRSDLPRFHRHLDADRHFPARGLLSTVGETMQALGLRLDAGGSIHLDTERRDGKSRRAFCSPARVPNEIYLALAPSGGREDFVALLHECGHAQHFAGVDRTLAFETRQLGDRAVGEAYAFLFDGLAANPAWLRRRLGIRDEQGHLARHTRAERLMFLRRYSAKLGYELELHAGGHGLSLTELRSVYSRRLSTALRVAWPEALWLSDLDPGLYVAVYLRAWALETQLRRSLCERFGDLWFERREAGNFLRALWRGGQARDAEELSHALGGPPLDLGLLLDDLGWAGEQEPDAVRTGASSPPR